MSSNTEHDTVILMVPDLKHRSALLTRVTRRQGASQKSPLWHFKRFHLCEEGAQGQSDSQSEGSESLRSWQGGVDRPRLQRQIQSWLDGRRFTRWAAALLIYAFFFSPDAQSKESFACTCTLLLLLLNYVLCIYKYFTHIFLSFILCITVYTTTGT